MHYSIDLWNTLFKSNPIFSSKRIQLLKNSFSLKKTDAQIAEIIENVGNEVYAENISKGISRPNNYIYKRLLTKLKVNFNSSSIENLISEVDVFFIEYPPKLIYPKNVLLNKVKDLRASGVTFNISSNTNYVAGKTIKTVFNNLEINDYFDFYIFSDEIASSKPSTSFFKYLIDECSKINKTQSEIYHFGDEYESDIVGAIESNIKYKHINNDLIKYL